ncbi:MAG: hypothetical protein IJQ56_12070, partial [Synergistaceae bacterium]|nr:hypothetical protein [Synergistaceae bacterium]
FWYIDGKYLGTSLPDNTFFHDMPDGSHVVSAADDTGRSVSVNVKVLTPGKSTQVEQIERLF